MYDVMFGKYEIWKFLYANVVLVGICVRASPIWVAYNAEDIAVQPAWCPPTPPMGEGDVYCERWSRALYRCGAAGEAALPAPPARRAPPSGRPRAAHAPLSLFEAGGARAGRARGARAAAPATPSAPAADWAGAEDAALRRALRLQRLPAEPAAALAPNWDWVAELVAEAARAHRSARACRDRHEALADPERARRRHRRGGPRRRATSPPRAPLLRLEAVRDAAERRRHRPRRRADDAPPRNPKHAALLADHGLDYDAPPTPMEVAARRADRIAREKLKAHAPPAPAAPTAPAPPAPAPAPAPPPTPRLVLAPEGARRPAPRAPPAHLVYRQQPFPTRHLKILHQAPAPHSQQGGSGVAGASDAPATLRKLQLQQVSLRRAPPAPAAPPSAPQAAPPAPAPHVLVAHLAPRASDAPPPPPRP